jgi:hypothetical protein
MRDSLYILVQTSVAGRAGMELTLRSLMSVMGIVRPLSDYTDDRSGGCSLHCSMRLIGCCSSLRRCTTRTRSAQAHYDHVEAFQSA